MRPLFTQSELNVHTECAHRSVRVHSPFPHRSSGKVECYRGFKRLNTGNHITFQLYLLHAVNRRVVSSGKESVQPLEDVLTIVVGNIPSFWSSPITFLVMVCIICWSSVPLVFAVFARLSLLPFDVWFTFVVWHPSNTFKIHLQIEITMDQITKRTFDCIFLFMS